MEEECQLLTLSYFSFLIFPFSGVPVWWISLHNSLQTGFRFHLLAPVRRTCSCGGTAAPGKHLMSCQRLGWNPRGLSHQALELRHAAVLAVQPAKADRTFTAFFLFLGCCSLPEYFLALTVVHDGLWFCLVLSGSWWDCQRLFEDFSDNQPQITPLFFFIPLLMSYFSCGISGMSITKRVFEGKEYGFHTVIWMSYIWFV